MWHRFQQLKLGAAIVAASVALGGQAHGQAGSDGFLTIQLEDLAFRPPGGARILIPRVPDLNLSFKALASDGAIVRRICLPDGKTCIEISIAPAKLALVKNAVEAKSAMCGAAATCNVSTTAFFYLTAEDVGVTTSGPGSSLQSAKVLGWEFSCTAGVSGGK